MPDKEQLLEVADKVRTAANRLKQERQNAKELIKAIMKDRRAIHVRPDSYWIRRTDLDPQTRELENLAEKSKMVSYYNPTSMNGRDYIESVVYNAEADEVYLLLHGHKSSAPVALFYVEEAEDVLQFMADNLS